MKQIMLFLKVANFESIALLGDFVAHVGTGDETWEIGRYEIAGANKKGPYLLQLCCSIGLSIINAFSHFFFTKILTNIRGKDQV